jgi:RNA polymerase sigma factor (TIGR02999 family)
MVSGDPPADRTEHGEVTLVLQAAAAGVPGQRERLLELVYEALKALATRHLSGERRDHTLQPTALVHEAWVKLFKQSVLPGGDRRHFLAVASQAMRRILVDHARGRRRAKRGGGAQRHGLDALDAVEGSGALSEQLDLVALDDALCALAERSPRQAQVVELRFFGGLAAPEVAETLDISVATVEREWRIARAWLAARLGA